MNGLQWRRQFLLTRSRIQRPAAWNCCQVGEYFLYSHPDLEVTALKGSEREFVLLGYLFSADQHEQSNEDILETLASQPAGFAQFTLALKPYAGRYVLLYRDQGGLRILQDALALREVYYCASGNVAVCASQPGLLQEFSEPRIEPSRNPDVTDFYTNQMKHVRSGRLWVGDGCYFEGVKHLLPNHCLHVESLRVERYWPNAAWAPTELGATVQRACAFLQGIMRAVTHRHSIMLAVTAGTDSRTLLAASREIRDRVYFFVNRPPTLSRKSADIRIPTRMFADLGIPFHVHDVEQEVDPEFRRTFLANAFLASDRLLPAIYNVYHRNHADKVNILGVGEIARDHWGADPAGLNAYYLAYTLHYKRSRYAVQQCGRWLDDARPVAEKYRLGVMTLLLWEQLLGNWGVVGNSESDIAIEEFDPFDSHYIYETLLAVDPRSIRGDRQVVFREMIRAMWPELLAYPFNPPDTAGESVKRLLKRVGVHSLVKHLTYQWNWRRYRHAR